MGINTANAADKNWIGGKQVMRRLIDADVFE